MLVFGIYLKPWWVWYVEGLSAKRALVIILLFGGGKFHIFFSIIIHGMLARLSWWLCLNQYLGWLVQSSYWDKVCGSVQTGNLVLEISAFFFFDHFLWFLDSISETGWVHLFDEFIFERWWRFAWKSLIFPLCAVGYEQVEECWNIMPDSVFDAADCLLLSFSFPLALQSSSW